MCAINDPLGDTNSPASSDHYYHLRVVWFREILKSGDGRTDSQTTLAKIVITLVTVVVLVDQSYRSTGIEMLLQRKVMQD